MLISEIFALVILTAFVFSAALFGWILLAKKKVAIRPVLLSLAITTALAIALLIFSTDLITKPFLELSIASLLKANAPAVLAFVILALGVGIGFLVSQRVSKNNRGAKAFSNISTWLLMAAAISFIGLLLFGMVPQQADAEQIEEDEESTEETIPLLQAAAETLPQGFELRPVFSEGAMDRPVAMAAGDDGEIYISTFAGGIYKLSAAPWDPATVQLIPFAPEVSQITGMVFTDGALYANGSGSLSKLADEDGDGFVDLTEVLIEGLPSRIYDHHSNNGLTLGEDGRFYFGLGGTTDHGPETHSLAGNILVYDPSDESLNIFAYGLRNPYDLAFCPNVGGELFVTDNGPDRLDESLRFVPPDELNLVKEGLSYGYPDFFGFPPPWSNTIAPIALLETAGVPAGIICYEEGNFPDEYRGDLFVALAGGSNPATGHKIVRVEITKRDGFPIGVVTDFLTGLGRPVDLIEYVDGSLLVLDYDLGQLYQIIYTGE